MNPRAALALVLAAAALGCAYRRGYYLDAPTRRIYAKDSWGRVTKWYEPGTPAYRKIAQQFWPELVDKPAAAPATQGGRRARMRAFMRGLSRDQWNIIMDLEMWTGNDQEDLSRLEDLEEMARAVKGLPFASYLEIKSRYPIGPEFRRHLLDKER